MFCYKIYAIKALKKCFSEDNSIRPSRTMALVAVFKYGVQLQKESDETL